MQIKFNPLNIKDRVAVSSILVMFRAGDETTTTESVPETTTTESVPETTTTESVPETTSVMLDAKNTPWIKGIHADAQTTNKDGTWRRRRGVDKDEATAAETAARNEVAPSMPLPDAPEMPAVTSEPLPNPIDMPALVAKANEVSTLIPDFDHAVVYNEVWNNIGLDGEYDPAAFATNETFRAGIFEAYETVLAEPAPQPVTGGMPV